MPTDTAASESATIPAGPGLPDRQPPAEPRRGNDLIDAAASGTDLTTSESDDLLAYFLSNDGLPGDAAVTPLTITLGHGDRAREFHCEVHPIEWAEWQDARVRATDAKTAVFDAYLQASWIVARALVTPKLGPTVARMQQDDPNTAPADAAALLRSMFKRQSGALLELSAKVLELSKLQSENQSVKEVDAGKR